MPNRVIREGILDSDRVDKLSWPAEVFYRRLMSIVDDFGRCDGRIQIIRSKLYPLRMDKVSMADVEKWMDECSIAGLISRYEVQNKPYLEILDFGQSLRRMVSAFPNKEGLFETKDEYVKRMNSNDISCKQTLPEKKGNESETNQNLKSLSLADIFINDLPNSSEFEKISMNVRVPKEELIKWIKPFKDSTMRLQYKNFVEFAEHFKNWYLKQDKTKLNVSQGPKKLGR